MYRPGTEVLTHPRRVASHDPEGALEPRQERILCRKVADAAGEGYSSILRRRSALAITDTELNVMAALAIIGLSSSPKKG